MQTPKASQKILSNLPLMVALIAGVLAVILVRSYINRMKTDLYEGMEMITVIAAAYDVNSGTAIKENMLKTVEVPLKFVSDRAVRLKDMNYIVGQQLVSPLKKGDIVLWSDLGEYGGKNKLSDIVTSKERALTIPVDKVSSVSGMIQPNDHIDIIATLTIPPGQKSSGKEDEGGGATMGMDTLTITLLQNVTVLATGTQLADTTLDQNAVARRSTDYNTVTLLVTQEEAQELIFAQTKGNLTLVLRNKEDFDTSKEFPKTRFNSILAEEFRQQVQTKRDKRIEVEVIRGRKQ